MQKQNTGSFKKRQRLDTTGTRASKSSESQNHLTQNASPHNMQRSTIWVHTQLPLVTRKKFFEISHHSPPNAKEDELYNFSPLLTMGLIKWVSKHSWRPLPLEWTSPWDATPLENMPWMQVECLTSFSGMVQAFTSSNKYSAEGSKTDLYKNAQENITLLN